MTPSSRLTTLCLAGLLLGAVNALAGPSLELDRHKPCNIFDLTEPVVLQARVSGLPPGTAEAQAEMTAYSGEVTKRTFPVTIGEDQKAQVPLDFGVMEPGYYELQVSIGGAKAEKMSLGVAKLTDRTAAEALAQGSRFGLKMFYLDKDAENPWMKAEFDEREVVTAFTKLGMQWTRADMHLTARLPTRTLIKDFPVNVVLKLEGMPENCYDEQRYGPREKKKEWRRGTVPLKAAYEAWLRQELSTIPKSQNTFEIGNETWNYHFQGQEFAEWSNMAADVIRAERPNAVIMADPGNAEYEENFIAGKGLEHINAIAYHPYSFTPLPEHRTRMSLRNLHDYYKARGGRDLDIYVTEYGWPTAPKDSRGHSVSEAVQAQRTTRQTLIMYAEDVKTLIPHWMGDREQDVTDREHWFGFFHQNHQPRPVVLAHATCAEMIDGGKFVGDLWLGPGVGALLFEKGGKYNLALWTLEEDKTVTVNTGAEEVLQVDLVGRRKTVPSPGGKLTLALSGNVTYLCGIGPDVVKTALPPSTELNPDLWSTRQATVKAPKMGTQPAIDGALGEWTGRAGTALLPSETPKPEVASSALVNWSWDANNLYASVQVKAEKPGSGESFDLCLGTRPGRQLDLGKVCIYDYIYTFKLAKDPAKTSLSLLNDMRSKPLTVTGGAPLPDGSRWSLKPVEGGWIAELAIPLKALPGTPALKPGLKLATQMRVNQDGKVRLVFGEEKTRLWPYLELTD